jgi:hypothetical protein
VAAHDQVLDAVARDVVVVYRLQQNGLFWRFYTFSSGKIASL